MARPRYRVPAEIGLDGTNCAPALKAWIATVPDGAVILFPPDRTYHLLERVDLVDRNGLTINGNWSTFVSDFVGPYDPPKPNRPMFQWVRGSDLTMRNVIGRGTNPADRFKVNLEWLHFLKIDGTQGGLVENVSVDGFYGDFANVNPDTSRGPGFHSVPDGITIRDFDATNIGRNGVSLTGCTNVVLERGDLTGIGYQTFDLENEGWWVNDVRISDMTVGGRIPGHVVVMVGPDVQRILVERLSMLTAGIACAPPVSIVDGKVARGDITVRDSTLRAKCPAARIHGVDGFTLEGCDLRYEVVGQAGCVNSGTAVDVQAGRAGSRVALRNNTLTGYAQLSKVTGTYPVVFEP